MSRSNDFPRRPRRAPGRASGAVAVATACGLALLTLHTALAQAAVEPAPESAAPAAKPVVAPRVAKADASVVSAKRAERRRVSIRCWQEGRLVYEGSVVAPTTRGTAGIEIRSADAADGGVMLLDLKSGLCLVESPAQP